MIAAESGAKMPLYNDHCFESSPILRVGLTRLESAVVTVLVGMLSPTALSKERLKHIFVDKEAPTACIKLLPEATQRYGC